MRKSFNYKAKVSDQTALQCWYWIEQCRHLYNAALEQRIILWNHKKQSLTYVDQTYEMKYLRKEIPQYKNINSQVLQDPLKRIDLAFKAFYKRCKRGDKKSGYPKFKKEGMYRSITFKNTGWELDGNVLDIYKVGKFKLFLSRPILGEIKTITIRVSRTNKWFVSFSCDNVEKTKHKPIENTITIRDDGSLTRPPELDKTLKRLKDLQLLISYKDVDSNRRMKMRHQIECVYEKMKNQRKDFIHKNTTNLVKNYNKIIIIESDKKNKDKPLYEMGWYSFLEILVQKANEYGTELVFKKGI